jgi:hypothetical protein
MSTTEWVYDAEAWWDSWRSGDWRILRHPRRHNGFYLVSYRGEEVTLRDTLELAKRFVERQAS